MFDFHISPFVSIILTIFFKLLIKLSSKFGLFSFRLTYSLSILVVLMIIKLFFKVSNLQQFSNQTQNKFKFSFFSIICIILSEILTRHSFFRFLKSISYGMIIIYLRKNNSNKLNLENSLFSSSSSKGDHISFNEKVKFIASLNSFF